MATILTISTARARKHTKLAFGLTVALGISAVGCSSSALTESVALEQLRADKNLPVRAEDLRIIGITDGETERVVKVDFGGTTANVKFRRFDKRWSPEQFETPTAGWVSLQTGFAMVTGAEEIAATETLKSLVSGQATYAASCGVGFYAPNLAALTTVPPGGTVGFVMDDLKPQAGNAFAEKAHYRIEIQTPPSPRSPASCNGVSAGTSGETWTATATRKKGYPGNSYKIDAEGQISAIQ